MKYLEVLPNVIAAGLKIEVMGPLICRRGTLLLKAGSVRVLGRGAYSSLFLPWGGRVKFIKPVGGGEYQVLKR